MICDDFSIFVGDKDITHIIGKITIRVVNNGTNF